MTAPARGSMTPEQDGVSPCSRGMKATSLRPVFNPDGSRILTASPTDGTVRLWNSATGREIGKLGESRQAVYCVAFSPDGSRIITAGYCGIAQLWDSATQKRLKASRWPKG